MSNKEYRTKNRYFEAILYKEDENFSKYFNNIKTKFTEVTYITHDRDITEEENGEIIKKKKHMHIIFKVGENARHLNSIAKDIEIAPNYLQGIKLIPMLRYLIHLDNPEKTQYDIEEVQGELKQRLKQEVDKTIEDEIPIKEIVRQIKGKYIKNMLDLIEYGIDNKQLLKIRKYQYLLTKLIDERRIKNYGNSKI